VAVAQEITLLLLLARVVQAVVEQVESTTALMQFQVQPTQVQAVVV
jgi:hypothetical protein